ncbi:MAG: hypothetical protein KDB80_05100 [Planctomycetes bacterium]|nr:hypothetical protein [Planctomycetota bacterium]
MGLILSLGSAATSVLGVQVHIDLGSVIAVIPRTAASSGYASFDMPLPVHTGILGQSIFTQLFVADPGAAQGVAASPGLQLTICDTSPERNLRQVAGIDASCWNVGDSTCTDNQPALTSSASPDGSTFDVVGVRVEVERETTITRLAGVGALASEDYANLTLSLVVYGHEATFGLSGMSPDQAVHVQHGISLTNTAPPEFGGQSPLGVPNRYLELDVEDFSLSSPLSDFGAPYWIVVYRADTSDEFVWSHTTIDLGSDSRAADFLGSIAVPLDAFGHTPGTVAIDVFGRTDCADFEIGGGFTDFLVTAYETYWPQAHAAFSSLGIVGCAPIMFIEHPLDGSAPVIVSTMRDVYAGGGLNCGSEPFRPQCTNPALSLAATQTSPGEISAWMCTYQLGTTSPGFSVFLLSRRVCPWW